MYFFNTGLITLLYFISDYLNMCALTIAIEKVSKPQQYHIRFAVLLT